ncbi:hypothetical protein SVIO_057990 [Streptomyces violaceusniger]|uniref:HTH tetR-type domain-containing protein n=1 Tax=Streptomyces violaceusniger TaxID=68280 RepID=A0A4D4L7K8_STRVO|nr:hypothetical protein SVIO_057990 [Streptomyces violaceusniger]
MLAAAYEELDRDSFAALTLDRLARRSGVHVSTIRRRWRTVEGVVVDLLAERSSTLPTPDTGDFHRDLMELTQAIADFNNALRNRNVMQGLIAAAAHDTGVEEIVRNAFVRRTEEVTLIVRNAVERGTSPRTPTRGRSSPHWRRRCTTGCSSCAGPSTSGWCTPPSR